VVLELEHKVNDDELEAGIFISCAFEILEDTSKQAYEEVEPRFLNRLKLGGRFELAFYFEIHVLVIAVLGSTSRQSAFEKQREYVNLILIYLLGFAKMVLHI